MDEIEDRSKSPNGISKTTDPDVSKPTDDSSSSLVDNSADGKKVGKNAFCEMESTSREVDIDTNPEDVKAPGLFERIKEEVEAVTQDVHEKHDSTDKQHSGFFHHLADKLGIHMQQKGSQSE